MNIFAATAVTAAENTASKPDYIALAIVAVLAIFVIIMVIRKNVSIKKSEKVQKAETKPISDVKPESAIPAPVAPGSAGKIKLHDVDDKTAAMLMAIVADKMGKPLNELRFISIKEVK